MKVSDRLQNLGIVLPNPVRALGAYAPAVRSGAHVYVSGQLPVQDSVLLYAGRVGLEVSLEEAQKAAALCFINALGALAGLDLPVDAISRVVRLTGYVCAAEGFTALADVLNGASELSLQIFGDAGVHARSAVGAYALPKGAAVELEAIFQIRV